LPNSSKKSKKILFRKEIIQKNGKKPGVWVKNTKSSSDTSIENTSSNESLDNYIEAFGEISINSCSEFIIILLIIILFIK